LKEGFNKGFELNQYGFQYFYLEAKNKRSPVRICEAFILLIKYKEIFLI